MTDASDGPRARVRLTEDAIEDLRRLHRKDPRVLRDVLAKMLLLERSPRAGQPLLGGLGGFRKLVVGNRAWRIVWRETQDESQNPILDIAEAWAAGAREDSDVYAEMEERVARLGREGHPQAQPLSEVVRAMGRLYQRLDVHDEPVSAPPLPAWLREGLAIELHLSDSEIASLTLDEARARMTAYWSESSPPQH